MDNNLDLLKKDRKIEKIFTLIVCLVATGLLILSAYDYKRASENHKFKYGIIYYPDTMTSIEGYVDRYIFKGDRIYITINGTMYITSTKNVLITEKESLTINKEIKDE